MANVNDLLIVKGRAVHTITPTATVFEAISTMVAHNVGALIVLERSLPVGIITERDYLRRVALEGRASRTTFVQEVMSTELLYVDPDTDVEECMNLMTRRRIRHLPVVGPEMSLVGIISIGDIVRHLARERQDTVEELTAYIQGRI